MQADAGGLGGFLRLQLQSFDNYQHNGYNQGEDFFCDFLG